MRRFANVPRYPGDHINSLNGRQFRDSYIRMQQEFDNSPVVPLTEVTYPQDSMPASFFGVDPTAIPLMRDNHIRSLKGGVSSNQPGMYKDLLYRDEDPKYRDLLYRGGEDGGYELLSFGIDPELQQALKEQKLFFDTEVMGG